jgi:uncharacterized protein (DUF1778 family)
VIVDLYAAASTVINLGLAAEIVICRREHKNVVALAEDFIVRLLNKLDQKAAEAEALKRTATE